MIEKELKKRMFELSTSNFNTMVDFGAYSAGYMDGGIFGYNLAVDKACEWLEKNVCTAYNFNGDENTSTIIDDFRKAMKGE